MSKSIIAVLHDGCMLSFSRKCQMLLTLHSPHQCVTGPLSDQHLLLSLVFIQASGYVCGATWCFPSFNDVDHYSCYGCHMWVFC